MLNTSLLTTAAPIAEVRKGNQAGWTVRINDAQLTLSGPRVTAPEIWRTTSTPAPFDVIASATLSLKVPANHYGYEGRSHSLWYADAQAEDQYQWFETAFMDTPLRTVVGTMAPFALDPHHESRAAIGPGMNMHQVAWPFTPLVIGDLDELISRWAAWLAQAATGQLAHPSHMPERDPHRQRLQRRPAPHHDLRHGRHRRDASRPPSPVRGLRNSARQPTTLNASRNASAEVVPHRYRVAHSGLPHAH
ncbi:hypothetical protein ACFXDH_48575 [Streptomyces sp. NPDC059467]|uniref:hypothetical protein n=1 Tax=Streptomyces sp. NPDC059467 TaxID=3346844 RepID=UPI003691283C